MEGKKRLQQLLTQREAELAEERAKRREAEQKLTAQAQVAAVTNAQLAATNAQLTALCSKLRNENCNLHHLHVSLCASGKAKEAENSAQVRQLQATVQALKEEGTHLRGRLMEAELLMRRLTAVVKDLKQMQLEEEEASLSVQAAVEVPAVLEDTCRTSAASTAGLSLQTLALEPAELPGKENSQAAVSKAAPAEGELASVAPPLAVGEPEPEPAKGDRGSELTVEQEQGSRGSAPAEDSGLECGGQEQLLQASTEKEPAGEEAPAESEVQQTPRPARSGSRSELPPETACPSTRTRPRQALVSYAEPSLGRKLRQGDAFTFGPVPTPQHKGAKGKQATVRKAA